MHMQLKNIYKDGRKFEKNVCELYEEAFPESEKKPWTVMEELVKQNKMEILAIEKEDEFIGLAINLIDGETALLDYFAIDPEKRNCGYGGDCIRTLLEKFRDKKYIFEIEMQDENAENAEDRKRRKAFYLRNGLKETGLFANVYQVDFEMLTPDGSLSYEQYTGFLERVLGKEYLRFLDPVLIQQRG